MDREDCLAESRVSIYVEAFDDVAEASPGPEHWSPVSTPVSRWKSPRVFVRQGSREDASLSFPSLKSLRSEIQADQVLSTQATEDGDEGWGVILSPYLPPSPLVARHYGPLGLRLLLKAFPEIVLEALLPFFKKSDLSSFALLERAARAIADQEPCRQASNLRLRGWKVLLAERRRAHFEEKRTTSITQRILGVTVILLCAQTVLSFMASLNLANGIPVPALLSPLFILLAVHLYLLLHHYKFYMATVRHYGYFVTLSLSMFAVVDVVAIILSPI